MSWTTKQIEQNSVNEVRNYIDSSSCLRSYLQENDKTPLWDGTIFAYCGVPDKKENFVGSVKAQIKGTEVTEFKERETYRVSVSDLNHYMHEGGVLFFVVEVSNTDLHKREVFYSLLTPHTIKAFVKKHKRKKGVTLDLYPLPLDYHIFEDKVLNFIENARKQVSFVDKQGLSLAEALRSPYPIRAEVSLNKSSNPTLSHMFTGQYMVMYQETLYASIPIEDVVLSGKATEHHQVSISVGGRKFFDGYTRIIEHTTITDNFGDCLIFSYPKEGQTKKPTCNIEIKYPHKGTIAESVNAVEFLKAVCEHGSITFGDKEVPLDFGSQKSHLFKDVEYCCKLYHDMSDAWDSLQIPGIFLLDDFTEGELNKFLNVVLHVHLKVPGQPTDNRDGSKSFYSLIEAGPLQLLIQFNHYQGELYSSIDAFSQPYYVEKGMLYPLLTAMMAQGKDVLRDNIHYKEQLNCYKDCLAKYPSFCQVVSHDIAELKRLLPQVTRKAKSEKVLWLIAELEKILN